MRVPVWPIGLGLSLLVLGSADGRMQCAPENLGAAATLRDEATAACPCSRTPRRCVRERVKMAIELGRLPGECRRRAVRCLVRTICDRSPIDVCSPVTATTPTSTTTTTTKPGGFPPIDLSGTWLLHGERSEDSCGEPDARFNSQLTIAQDGVNLRYAGDVSGVGGTLYSTWRSATEFTLQPDLPVGAVRLPGGPDSCVYDFYLSLFGTYDPSDASIHLVQQRYYFPIVATCTGCSAEWTGTMQKLN
jgi:hypothetical protein